MAIKPLAKTPKIPTTVTDPNGLLKALYMQLIEIHATINALVNWVNEHDTTP